MKHKWIKYLFVAAVATLLAIPAVAANKGDVVVELTGKKVLKNAAGKEMFETADKAKPGDVIEYKAVYRNKGKTAADNLLATIPVPLGTDYLPGSAKPADVSASLDGKEYAPAPLKRKVKLPSGKEELRDVPAGEYRSLRWSLKALEPGKSATVSMRVRVSTEQAKP
jgi:uncharacterized repeat protein (TIGR01451 family)